MTTEKKNYPLVDLAKFILSIMVVAIHVSPVGEECRAMLLPILRIAVPLFFMISAVFLFSKIDRRSTLREKRDAVIHFVKRNGFLYLFWYALLFVPTLHFRWDLYSGWFDAGFLYGIVRYLLSVLFLSTFIASWYIAASVVAVLLIFAMERHLGKPACVIFAILCFVFSALLSNYHFCLPDWTLQYVDEVTSVVLPYNSFPIAFFWMYLGRLIASFVRNGNSISLPVVFAGVIIGCALLYTERTIIAINGWAYADDVYFSLPLICVSVLILLFKADCSIAPKASAFFRATSTITYCLHATLGRLMIPLGLSLPLRFAIVLLACWMLTFLLMRLEKVRGLTWLKYSH